MCNVNCKINTFLMWTLHKSAKQGICNSLEWENEKMDKINEHLQGSTFLLGMCLLLCVPWLQFQNKDKFSRKKKRKNGKARDLRVFACAFNDIEWAWNPVQEIQVSVTAMQVRQTLDQDLDPGDLWRFDWSPLSLILSCLIKTFSKALQRVEPDIIRSGRRYIEEVVEYLIKSSRLTL